MDEAEWVVMILRLMGRGLHRGESHGPISKVRPLLKGGSMDYERLREFMNGVSLSAFETVLFLWKGNEEGGMPRMKSFTEAADCVYGSIEAIDEDRADAERE